MVAVALEGIHKSFGTQEVLKDISLEIEDKAFVAFVGPSGCGKSTLLRVIAGLEAVSAGEIRIGERRVNDVPAPDRGAAMVFQSYALYPHMTVWENMSFSLRLKGVSRTERRRQAEKVAQTLQLNALLDRKPGQLSGGQRQRVAIGRALMREPDLFLFDEPLSNLDAALRTEMRVELTRLHQAIGNTMIYVTHDQVEAMTMADQIVVLQQGRVMQVGAPMELYNRPNSRFVAEFIGAPKINLFQGTVESEGPDATRVRVANGTVLDLPSHAVSAGADVTLGVRPEALTVAAASLGAETDGSFQATVDVVEHLGAEALVYCEVQGHAGSIRVTTAGGTSLKPGMAIQLTLDGDACHLFCKNGTRLERKADRRAHVPT